MKVCPKCRKKIDSDVKFCTNCGYPFDENEDDKKGNKKDKILYIVLAAVLVLLVATTALILNSKYHFLQVKGSEDEANDTEMTETMKTEEESKPTQTATPTASVSEKPTQTATPTAKPSSTPTPTPSASSTSAAKTSPTPSAKATPTPTAKATPTPSKAPAAESNQFIKDDLDVVSFKGHEYYVFPPETATTWEQAKTICEKLGGHLATINNKEEDQFLFEYMKSCGYDSAYFGYSDNINEGEWYWVTGESITYTNWATSEPNQENAREDYCFYYYKYPDGTWNDGDFAVGNHTTDSNAFICEWD